MMFDRSRQSQDILRTPSLRRTRRSIRSGYAFAHQEGFGRLITSGKIMRKIPRPATDFSFPLNFGSGSLSPRKPVVATSSSSNAGAFNTLAPPEIPGFNEQSWFLWYLWITVISASELLVENCGAFFFKDFQHLVVTKVFLHNLNKEFFYAAIHLKIGYERLNLES
jgi:hypothetical protein